jgi:hypothetical protein
MAWPKHPKSNFRIQTGYTDPSHNAAEDPMVIILSEVLARITLTGIWIRGRAHNTIPLHNP